jgi:glycerate kinase
MSDGGEGFGEVMSALLGARRLQVRTMDAAHRPCLASWWWDAKRGTAIIETASVIGLAMLPPERFHPFELDTFGLAALFMAARRKGAKRCVVGIGGSATNDAGFGLARALGWEFLDRNGCALERWLELSSLAAIRCPRRERWFDELVVAVDVQNPLLGRHGATRIYGPQKGLRPRDFRQAERCLHQLKTIWKKEFGRDLSRVPGSGAAGGLGFGLMAFANARLQPGFELFSRLAVLERRLRSSDLVVTGEGSVDESTLMGKGVGEIALKCSSLGIPCIGLAGKVTRSARLIRAFSRFHAMTELTSEKEAKARPALWLERLTERVAMKISDQREEG